MESWIILVNDREGNFGVVGPFSTRDEAQEFYNSLDEDDSFVEFCQDEGDMRIVKCTNPW